MNLLFAVGYLVLGLSCCTAGNGSRGSSRQTGGLGNGNGRSASRKTSNAFGSSAETGEVSRWLSVPQQLKSLPFTAGADMLHPNPQDKTDLDVQRGGGGGSLISYSPSLQPYLIHLVGAEVTNTEYCISATLANNSCDRTHTLCKLFFPEPKQVVEVSGQKALRQICYSSYNKKTQIMHTYVMEMPYGVASFIEEGGKLVHRATLLKDSKVVIDFEGRERSQPPVPFGAMFKYGNFDILYSSVEKHFPQDNDSGEFPISPKTMFVVQKTLKKNCRQADFPHFHGSAVFSQNDEGMDWQ